MQLLDPLTRRDLLTCGVARACTRASSRTLLHNFVVNQYAMPLTSVMLLNTVFSRLNAGGVYLKLGLLDPAVYSNPAFIY